MDWSDPRRQVEFPPDADLSFEAIHGALTDRELELLISDETGEDQAGPR